jgi:O-glycosyl hydrolase
LVGARGLLAQGPIRAAETARLRLDPLVTCQVIDGFGASDAWQCDGVGRNWPLAKREQIADLLFSREVDAQGNPKGIGLSIWRFNLGAGTSEQGEASGIGNPSRRAACFLKADGTYDWSSQAGQQWFLRAARARGVETVIAFANAPPVHLSRNGKGYAPKGLPALNVQPGKLDDFAVFLANVLEHFQKEGQPFDYLSPVNEPQWAWDDAGQEGTPALNDEVYVLVRYLSHELSTRGLKSRIVIGEAGTIGHAFMTMNFKGLVSDGRDDQARAFFSPSSPCYIGNWPNVALILSAHDYHSIWPLDKLVEYRQMLHQALNAVNPDLGYWQSEYCVLEEPNDQLPGGAKRDLGMDTALYVARILHVNLTVAQARSWQWWTALSEVDFKDGLIYLDKVAVAKPHRTGADNPSLRPDGEVRDSRLLWALGNFSRFIRPGMVRIPCAITPEQSLADGLLASAYLDAKDNRVVVLINQGKEDQPCDLGLMGDADVYTTSSQASLSKSRQPASRLSLPARSVTTVVLPARFFESRSSP